MRIKVVGIASLESDLHSTSYVLCITFYVLHSMSYVLLSYILRPLSSIFVLFPMSYGSDHTQFFTSLLVLSKLACILKISLLNCLTVPHSCTAQMVPYVTWQQDNIKHGLCCLYITFHNTKTSEFILSDVVGNIKHHWPGFGVAKDKWREQPKISC